MEIGPAGLTALKALREEGFDVVGFERREELGGVWSYSTNPNFTSVIPETIANVSKFVVGHIFYLVINMLTSQSGFSDFPVPKGLSLQLLECFCY
jgi:dimethylaniline monooxygenase (N-oxide forming)